MTKLDNKPIRATFRQQLEGCLVDLRCAPHWAIPAIYAAKIHPIILEASRGIVGVDATPSQSAIIDLIDRLNHDNAGNCGVVIQRWLQERPNAGQVAAAASGPARVGAKVRRTYRACGLSLKAVAIWSHGS